MRTTSPTTRTIRSKRRGAAADKRNSRRSVQAMRRWSCDRTARARFPRRAAIALRIARSRPQRRRASGAARCRKRISRRSIRAIQRRSRDSAAHAIARRATIASRIARSRARSGAIRVNHCQIAAIRTTARAQCAKAFRCALAHVDATFRARGRPTSRWLGTQRDRGRSFERPRGRRGAPVRRPRRSRARAGSDAAVTRRSSGTDLNNDIRPWLFARPT